MDIGEWGAIDVEYDTLLLVGVRCYRPPHVCNSDRLMWAYWGELRGDTISWRREMQYTYVERVIPIPPNILDKVKASWTKEYLRRVAEGEE